MFRVTLHIPGLSPDHQSCGSADPFFFFGKLEISLYIPLIFCPGEKCVCNSYQRTTPVSIKSISQDFIFGLEVCFYGENMYLCDPLNPVKELFFRLTYATYFYSWLDNEWSLPSPCILLWPRMLFFTCVQNERERKIYSFS